MPTTTEELKLKSTHFHGWLRVGGWEPDSNDPPLVGRLKLTLECNGYRTNGKGVLESEMNRENMRALFVQAAEALSDRICNLNGIE